MGGPQRDRIHAQECGAGAQVGSSPQSGMGVHGRSCVLRGPGDSRGPLQCAPQGGRILSEIRRQGSLGLQLLLLLRIFLLCQLGAPHQLQQGHLEGSDWAGED